MRFDRITTIIMLVLMAGAVGLLVYITFFNEDKEEKENDQRRLDLKERELELTEQWLEDSKSKQGKNKVVDLTPQKSEIEPKTTTDAAN